MKKYNKPLLAVSGYTKQCVVADGVSPADVKVLYNSIDVDVWRREFGKPILREELKLPDDTLLVGTVTRIAQRHKDLSTFYKVAAKVVQTLPKVKFVIVGDGHADEMRKAQKEVDSLGLADVLFFTGHRTDLLDVYSSLDLFLMTSITEGLPNTVLEAMSMRVPVVSTAVAGVPELVIDKQTGLIAPLKDVEQLAGHVLTLLQNVDLRRDFSYAARKRVENTFSFSNRVKMMEEYYQKFSQWLSK